MSLSDNNYTEEFQPFNVATLERYDGEMSNRSDETPADLGRFKMLYEKPAFDPSPEDDFKALYTPPELNEKVFFTPLIKDEKKKTRRKDPRFEEPAAKSMEAEDPVPKEREPEETAEQKGFKEGYDTGLAKGQELGFEQGHKEGQEKGYAEGLARGEAQGLEQGEIKGREQGHEEGLASGQQEAEREGRRAIQSLEQTLASVNDSLPQLLEKYEDKIIKLIEKICNKVIQATVEVDDEVVKPIIMDTLRALVEPEEIELTVSEQDYEYIEMVKDDFFEGIDTLEHISVKSDPLLPRGGCKVQTRTATVQTDPESRLAAVFEAIRQVKIAG